MKALLAFLRDEDGATAIEYALLAAIISIGAMAAMTTVGTNLNSIFDKVGSALE